MAPWKLCVYRKRSFHRTRWFVGELLLFVIHSTDVSKCSVSDWNHHDEADGLHLSDQ